MANPASAVSSPGGFGVTLRRDLWWVGPLATATGLFLFIVYSTWRAFEAVHYEWGPYTSPFYSPQFAFPSFWPEWIPRSPAFLIVWAPAGFRLTCYYFRQVYYRTYFLDPPACAVGERSKRRYKGETAFPFVLQNLHRYFLYVALALLVFHWHDVGLAFFFDDGFGVGVGSLVLLVDTSLLTLYVCGCHALRHLIGGNVDCFSCVSLGDVKHKTWSLVSILNRTHMFWAWTSLVMVGFADLYVRMVASGVWTDVRIF